VHASRSMLHLFVAISGLLLGQTVVAEPVWQITGEPVPQLESFDVWMQTFMQEHNISAGSLAVTNNSRLVLGRGYTYSDDPEDLVVQPDSRFRLGSITKSITAMAVMHLVQSGQLSLDQQVFDLIDMPAPLDNRVRQITVRQLLQHLAGWDANISGDVFFSDAIISNELGIPLAISADNIIDYATTRRSLDHEPGTTLAYCNYCYLLLGRIIEASSGLPYEQYVQRRVLFPLGVRNMSRGRTLYGHRQPNEVKYHDPYFYPTVMDPSGDMVPGPYGAFNVDNGVSVGAIISSAVDLIRFATSLDNPEHNPVLGPAAVETMFGLPENIPPASYQPGDEYFAMGWEVADYGDERTTWHGGAAPGTMGMVVRRPDGINYAALFNRLGPWFPELEEGLWDTASAVDEWPENDQFEMLQHAPSGGDTYGGLMYDRSRDGHGLDLRVAGPSFNLLFYTYDENGEPEWYIAQGSVHEQLFVAKSIYYVTYDVERSPPQQYDLATLGHFIIDFREAGTEAACNDGVDRSHATRLALFDWSVNGKRGQWCIEPLVFGNGAPTPDLNGTWYAGPDDDGWGITVAIQGNTVFVVLYYYDAQGKPRFSVGSAQGYDNSSPITIPMLHVEGFCRHCEQGTSFTGNGTLDLNLKTASLYGGEGNSVSVDVEFLGEAGGVWQRDNVDMRLITLPVE
jgi:CubicO group peptidase (beta-lactamase class C family)